MFSVFGFDMSLFSSFCVSCVLYGKHVTLSLLLIPLEYLFSMFCLQVTGDRLSGISIGDNCPLHVLECICIPVVCGLSGVPGWVTLEA